MASNLIHKSSLSMLSVLKQLSVRRPPSFVISLGFCSDSKRAYKCTRTTKLGYVQNLNCLGNNDIMCLFQLNCKQILLVCDWIEVLFSDL